MHCRSLCYFPATSGLLVYYFRCRSSSSILSTYIPKYSFYRITDKINQKNYIVYYSNEFIMNNYIISDQILDSIYLIDNNLFINEFKQFFNILKCAVNL